MEDIHSCRRSRLSERVTSARPGNVEPLTTRGNASSTKRRRRQILLALCLGSLFSGADFFGGADLFGGADNFASANDMRRTPVDVPRADKSDQADRSTVRLPGIDNSVANAGQDKVIEWIDFDQLLQPEQMGSVDSQAENPLAATSTESQSHDLTEATGKFSAGLLPGGLAEEPENQRFRFVFEPASSTSSGVGSVVGNVVNRTPVLEGAELASGANGLSALSEATGQQPALLSENKTSLVPEPVNEVEKTAPPVWNVYITNPVAPAPMQPVTVQPAPISIYNVPPSPEVKVDEVALRRKEIGAKVSEEILGKRSDRAPVMPSVPLSEAVTAVQLLRECEEKALSADRLLKRGAAFAAREDVIAALGSFAAARDMQVGGRSAMNAFDAAMNAMREAGDFLGRYGNVDQDGVVRMVASHETEILKDANLAELTPHAAADMYLDYARMNLTYLVSGHAQGARLLLLLANAERDRKAKDSNLSEAIAITCMRAAVGASPDDPLLASELGFHALRAGHLGEARWTLERSLAIQPSTPAMQNLAETYRLAGDTERARQIVASLPGSSTGPNRSMLVTTVPASTFAQLSPPVQTQGLNAAQQYLAMQPTVPQQTIHQANTQVHSGRAHHSQNPNGQPAALGFNRGPQAPVSQPVPESAGPSVLDRMATAVKGAWR